MDKVNQRRRDREDMAGLSQDQDETTASDPRGESKSFTFSSKLSLEEV